MGAYEVDGIDFLFCPNENLLRCISDVREDVIHARLRRLSSSNLWEIATRVSTMSRTS
jgi:hypothetical protein